MFSRSFVCLSVAESPTVVACASVTENIDNDTYFYEVNADHGSCPDDGFCRVISKVAINDGEPYTMTVEIMNVVGKNGLIHQGHPRRRVQFRRSLLQVGSLLTICG